jgi:hypothetical protein
VLTSFQYSPKVQLNCSGGTHLPGHIAPFGYGTCGDMEQHSDASFAALGFVRHFEFTKNQTFLKDISYPFLKRIAAWWTCWLKRSAFCSLYWSFSTEYINVEFAPDFWIHVMMKMNNHKSKAKT